MRQALKLIKRIEVNYLRSLYRLEIRDVGDLNVIFGKNDSGKSNLLRALNLFFNGHPEPGRDFDFSLDMSDIRKREARDAKGKQFIWIKITFSVPTNYKNSLGSEIEVKRQWNRSGEVTQTVWPKSLSEGSKSARLTRFLNDIDFTYIPAIKDISLYSDLVERLYGAAVQSAAISNATEEFVNQIGRVNTGLTENLRSLFGSKSALAAPTELSQLFRNLDFSYGDEEHSLIRQKGDGIKARHIPEILRSINDGEARSKFYLWGFEEPENSLDLSSANHEASRFADIASVSDTQIFLSSHSPAFYLAEAEACQVRRLFISKQEKIAKEIRPENAAQIVQTIDEAEVAMEAAGLLHLPFVIRTLGDMPKKISSLEKDKAVLEQRLNDVDRPTVFLEGKHDTSIISSRFQDECEFSFREIGGTPQTIPALLKAISGNGRFELGSRVLIVFDNDPPGRSAVGKILGTQPIDYSVPNHVAGQISVMCLPHNYCSHFNNFKSYVGLSDSEVIFEGEFLLDVELASQELANKDFDKRFIHQDYHKKPQEMHWKMHEYEIGTPGWLFSRTVPDDLKKEIIDAILGHGRCPSLDQLESEIRAFFS